MPTLSDLLPQDQRLALAVSAKSPATLAQAFASHVGQFYDRPAFDALARQVADLYADDDADRFRRQLDRRLSDHYHTPVLWEEGEKWSMVSDQGQSSEPEVASSEGREVDMRQREEDA